MARRSSSSYLEHLARVPLFSALNKKELQKVAKASDEVTLREGKEFVKQDSIGREAFVIVDGKATVRRNNRKIAEIGPGAIVGEMALLDRGPRTASVVADGDLTVLVLGQREFSGVLDEVPGIAHKLLATLASRVRELDKKTYG